MTTAGVQMGLAHSENQRADPEISTGGIEAPPRNSVIPVGRSQAPQARTLTKPLLSERRSDLEDSLVYDMCLLVDQSPNA